MDYSNILFIIAAIAVTFVLAFIIGWFIHSKIASNKISVAKENAATIIADAEKEAKNIKREKLLEVKDEWLKKKQEFDGEKIQNFRNCKFMKRKLSSVSKV